MESRANACKSSVAPKSQKVAMWVSTREEEEEEEEEEDEEDVEEMDGGAKEAILLSSV